MNTDFKHIESLLSLFMQGETTLEQEQELRQFFAKSSIIPEQWEPYKEMMAYFDDGMPVETVHKPRRNITRTVWVVAAATVAAIVIITIPYLRSRNDNKVANITPPAVTVKSDSVIIQESEINIPTHPIITKAENKTADIITAERKVNKKTKSKNNTTTSKASPNAIEAEREKGEIEQAQQELMADRFIIEQERQEVLDEQYAGRAQAFQARQAFNNENPQFLQVVFK